MYANLNYIIKAKKSKVYRSTLVCFLLFSFNLISFSQSIEQKYSDIEMLKKNIRQGTYYDSSVVFKNGEKAIKLAKERNSLSDEATIYQYYGDFSYFSHNYKSATKYYDKAFEIAKKSNNIRIQNTIKIRKAFIMSEKDAFKGEKEFHTLLEEAQKFDLKINMVESYNGLGIIYERRNIYDQAMSFYLKGLRIAEKNNLSYQKAIILNNIGLIKFRNNQLSEAVIDFNKALDQAIKAQETRLEISVRNNLGLVTSALKKYDESIIHYKKTLKNAHALGFPIAIGAAMINLGNAYYEKKDYKNAKVYTDSSIYVFKKFNEISYEGISYLLKGMILVEQNKLKEAVSCIDSVHKFNQLEPNILNYMNSFDVLSEIEQKRNNFKLAFEYSSKFHNIKDSVENTTNKNKLAELQVLYGKEKIESELTNVKTKNKLLSKENELKQSRLNFVIIISVFIVIISLIIIFLRNIYKAKKQQTEFSQKLILKIDEERSRISKDLHDDIGQSLSVIKSKINMYNTKRLDTIEGLEPELGQVIEQTRKISHSLHPSFLEKVGLSRAINSMLEKVQESTGIICSIEQNIDIENISKNSKGQLYRVIQECLNNTIKHSQAKALKISIDKVDASYQLIYQDNGKGIALNSAITDGIGMMTIKERIKQINGKVLFENQFKGFKIIIKF